MMPALLQLLRYLEKTLDPARQDRIAGLFADTLNWRPVKRLPLVLTYPLPEDFPFRPYPVRAKGSKPGVRMSSRERNR